MDRQTSRIPLSPEAQFAPHGTAYGVCSASQCIFSPVPRKGPHQPQDNVGEMQGGTPLQTARERDLGRLHLEPTPADYPGAVTILCDVLDCWLDKLHRRMVPDSGFRSPDFGKPRRKSGNSVTRSLPVSHGDLSCGLTQMEGSFT